MRRIYDHPEEARQIGERGRAQITRLLAPEVVGQRMRAALEELIAAPDIEPQQDASATHRATKTSSVAGKVHARGTRRSRTANRLAVA